AGWRRGWRVRGRGRTLAGPWAAAAALSLGALTSGCAVVTVTDADGTQVTSMQAGVEVGNPTRDRPRFIRTSMLGIGSANGRLDIGLRTEDVVVVPDGCHAVFVVPPDAPLQTTAELAQLVQESCIVER